MIRVGLLDTTVPNSHGSMGRYRKQLLAAVSAFANDEVELSTEFLGCDQAKLDRTPPRLQMWRRHKTIWNTARKRDLSRYDLVHLLDGSFGYVAGAIRSKPVVTTVHDVIPRLQIEGRFPGSPRMGHAARWLVKTSLRGVAKSTSVCVDSENSANDLTRFTDLTRNQLTVVPLAIEPDLFQDSHAANAVVDLDTPYVFHLGNNGFYKNRIGAIEVFDRIDPKIGMHLILAGPPPNPSLRDRALASNEPDRIHFVDNPSQQQLASLYASAAVFVFPSRYEGFGWPPLEAMSAGCPVVSSDAGSLPEVVGDAGTIVDDGDYDAMAKACGRLTLDKSYRDALISAGHERTKQFSLELLAERMVSFYQAAMEKRRNR